nr:hypothetical protein [Tanacetum cinerariifolium]
MANLAFAPQHNMIAYLEKTESNDEFHQIVDFITSSSINHSLTVSHTIYASNIEQFWNSATSQTFNDEKQIHAIVDGKIVVILESSVRRDLLFNDANGITCLTNEQIFENLLLMGLVRAATTASLNAKHDSSNITKTQSKEILNEPTLQGEGLGSGLGRKETIGGTMAQIRSAGVLIQSIDPPLLIGYTIRSHTPGSDEGSMTLKELTDLCTTLLQKVFDLENVKTAQANKIANLKKRITKMEQRQRSRFLGFHPFRAGSSKRHGLDKGNGEKGGNTIETISTTRPDISVARPEDRTAEPKTPPTIITLFDDKDGTITNTLDLKKMKRELEVERKKVAGSSSKHKSPKKQKVNNQDSRDSDEEHRKCLKVVPDVDKAIDYETLDVKSPIIDCESQVLGTNKVGDIHVYKLTRLDGSYRHLSTFSRMFEVLDRQDVLDLHKIIMKRFPANDPEGYALILWGDLKTLVKSSKDDEIWRNQQDWKLLSWKLYETCGIYTLMLDDSSVSINMFVEKRYPLTKEILKKMLSSRLEAETKSTLALDLIKFIKLQIEEK